MTRAYHPHLSTLQLLAEVRRLNGVASAMLVAPRHGTDPQPACIRVLLSTGPKYLSLDEARDLVVTHPPQEAVSSIL
jgi:hypothetical protein